MSGYGKFAEVYDELTQNVEYKKRAKYLHTLLKRCNVPDGACVLDLACGTGSASVAVVLWVQGKLPGNRLTVENPGGTLQITLKGQNGKIDELYLEGPAENLQESQI